MKEKISEIESLLSDKQNIIITVHKSPDADALGSALALYNVLKKLHHNVNVISPNNYASFLYWMKGNEDVIIFTDEKDKCIDITNKSDLIFLLDFNDLGRIGDYAKTVRESTSTKIMIDHHQDPNFLDADIIISDTKSSSTAQLLFEVLTNLGCSHLIDVNVSECIYAGIMTDTGSFKFASTSSKTHKIVSKLIENGADNSKVHNLVYDNFSENRTNLLGYCLNKKMVIYPESNSAIISLSEQELESFNFKNGDTEGIVNYALAVKGVIFAVFIAEKEGLVKLSLRSKRDFKVNGIAKKYFKGGGHENASGGISELSLLDTIIKVEGIFNQYKSKLTKLN